jgi:CheY-like chemotaxis protein
VAARILVIEDNPANLELMTYLLRAFGHAVSSAPDGVQGLQAAQRELPDLIVCDLQLPAMNGYDVARKLKAEAGLRSIPLVAVTAFAMVDDAQKALDAGFDGYLTKPITPETFVSQVEAFLASELRGTSPHGHDPRR